MKKKAYVFFVLVTLITVIALHFLVNSMQGSQIIGTSDTFATISANHQRKLFYTNGLHWIFFCNGTQIFYSSSSNGINWNKPIAVENSSSGSAISIWFDQKIHYVYASGVQGSPVLYRRGEIVGKEIIWEEYSTCIESRGPSYRYFNGYCIKDGHGYPWAACLGSDEGSWCAYAVKALVVEGNAWMQPQIIFGPFVTPARVAILPLEDGKVYAVCAGTDGARGRLWNGTSWGSEEVITSASLVAEYGYSAASLGDKVHLVLLEKSKHDILYFLRTDEANWQEEVVERGLDDLSLPAICLDESNGNLYCFWIHNNTIWLKEKVNGVWKNPTHPFGVDFGKLRGISCFYKVFESMVGVAWLEQHNDLYEVKYRFLLV